MHHAIAHKLRILQAGNHAKNALLFSKLQIGLKAHQIIHAALSVLCSKLHIRPRTMTGSRIGQSHRPQRTVAHGIRSAPCHDLDRHASFVNRQIAVKIMQRRTLSILQRRMESLISLFVKRTIQIVGLAPAIAGSCKNAVHIQAFCRHNRRRRIVKRQLLPTGKPCNILGQLSLCERSGRHNGNGVRAGFPHKANFFPPNGNSRRVLHQFCHLLAELGAVHCQRTACRHTAAFCYLQQAVSQKLHFRFQQTGSRIQPVRLQRIGTNQFRKSAVFMRRRKIMRFLLVQLYLKSIFCKVERGLTACEARAQNPNLHCP